MIGEAVGNSRRSSACRSIAACRKISCRLNDRDHDPERKAVLQAAAMRASLGCGADFTLAAAAEREGHALGPLFWPNPTPVDVGQAYIRKLTYGLGERQVAPPMVDFRPHFRRKSDSSHWGHPRRRAALFLFLIIRY